MDIENAFLVQGMCSADSSHDVVFTFPGQGAFRRNTLQDIYGNFPELRPLFYMADAIVKQWLHIDFISFINDSSEQEYEKLLTLHPNIDQIGIYLTNVCLAKLLIEKGITPSLLVGHSFGELAALTIAGVIDLEAGLIIVCQRVVSLQESNAQGCMAAVSCGVDRISSILMDANKKGIEVAVINYDNQTVLSGSRESLESIVPLLAQQGIGVTFLKSRYPYHSSFLRGAVAPFRNYLKKHVFHAPSIQTVLGTEQCILSQGINLVEALSNQFIQKLDFKNIALSAYAGGYRTFIECGAGNIVSKIISTNLKNHDDFTCISSAPSDVGVAKSIKSIVETVGKEDINDFPVDSFKGGSQQTHSAYEVMATMMANLNTLVKDMSALVENTSTLMQLASRNGIGGESGGRIEASVMENIDKAVKAASGTISQLGSKAVSLDENIKQVNHDVPDDSQLESDIVSDYVAEQEQLTDTQDKDYPEENKELEPVAIVSLGCVLPGASDAEEFWANINRGVSGIVDLAKLDPDAARDFVAGSVESAINIVPDKTYTLLNGTVNSLDYNEDTLGSSIREEEFNSLTRGQKLLASAIGQAISGLSATTNIKIGDKIQCILGATADGSIEFDESQFIDSLISYLDELDITQPIRDEVCNTLESVFGYNAGDSRKLTQHKLYEQIIHRLVGEKCKAYIVDSACSSSLYSIGIGVSLLQNHEADAILTGGVFSPGPANNTLFAQFRGLTPTQSRPLDKDADGVVFGEGAAVAVLKRLSDAMRDGDKILGVIRGIGMSSDGKSSSINVPQKHGQCLSMNKVYNETGISPDTIQYVEAHATATQVGDAVEFSALNEIMRRKNDTKIELGSVKALIGHTGWVSGIASIIKICKMFEYRQIPPQYNFTEFGKSLNIDASPFKVSLKNHAWDENISSLPRRAGVNGFGFGGTNAHVILEEYNQSYHAYICQGRTSKSKSKSRLAVVALAGLFPDENDLFTEIPPQNNVGSRTRFRRDLLRLPAKKLLLPDVREHMDVSQYLSALCAERIFSDIPDFLQEERENIGVVFGLESKTDRGVRANERIYLDRFKRLISAVDMQQEIKNVIETVIQRIQNEVIPSGPYTLPGLMPNVTASRIAHMFDLKGPNLVVDMGENSLMQAVQVARDLIAKKECRMIIAGGVNAIPDSDSREAAVAVALVDSEEAIKSNLDILAYLDFEPTSSVDKQEVAVASSVTGNSRGATGGDELYKAIIEARDLGIATVIRGQGWYESKLALSVIPAKELVNDRVKMPVAASTTSKTIDSGTKRELPSTHAYVQDTPIFCYTPERVEKKAEGNPIVLASRRILFLTDQPEWWAGLEKDDVFRGLNYTVLYPGNGFTSLKNGRTLDVSTDERISETLDSISVEEFTTIIVIQNLENSQEDSILQAEQEHSRTLLSMLFAVTRRFYDHVQNGSVQLVTLCMDAYRSGLLDPHTGLYSGFMKSTVRECPKAICRIINTDSRDFHACMADIGIELGNPQYTGEVCYLEGARGEVILKPLQNLAKDTVAYINKDSVVIATGGGRGVTAVLAEQLIREYGCTVIALGRTSIDQAPQFVHEMDEKSFNNYEAVFYKEELAKSDSGTIVDIKRKYRNFQAINEIYRTIKSMEALDGKYEYISVDINNTKEVQRVVGYVGDKYGKVDLVVHGAGIQISTNLTKKSVIDFRRIVDTKLTSLSNLYLSCAALNERNPVHFHILTSAFSYMGNDGQPDYGAANEAMNRLAACMSARYPRARWSTLAWLGWAGIGMTRGTEYAALAASRNLRGVTKEEGQRIFSSLMAGTPTTPINITLAQGEIDYYGVDVNTGFVKYGEAINQLEVPPGRNSQAKVPSNDEYNYNWDISLENAPFLADHIVNGMVTAPGAFLTVLIGETAQQILPDYKIIAFENAQYHKFIRIYPGRTTKLRLSAKLIYKREQEALLQFTVWTDFVHKSGVVLQSNIRHKEIAVKMSMDPQRASTLPLNTPLDRANALTDPYINESASVSLSGQFVSMTDILVNQTNRQATFQLPESNYPDNIYQHLMPDMIMMDTCWRFGAIHQLDNGLMPIYVPESCDSMQLFYDFSDKLHNPAKSRLRLVGTNPVVTGDLMRLGSLKVVDQWDNVILIVTGAVCRRFGEVRDALSA